MGGGPRRGAPTLRRTAHYAIYEFKSDNLIQLEAALLA